MAIRVNEEWNYEDSEGKYKDLLSLYNSWNRRTKFLSVGNTDVEEWYHLSDYCKNHPEETARFYLDLIDCYTQEHDEGFRSDNFVGFFGSIIGEIFKDSGIPKSNNFVGGETVQKIYSTWIKNQYLKK